MIDKIKDTELCTAAAIYITKNPEYSSEILKMVSELSIKKGYDKDYHSLFRSIEMSQDKETAKTACSNLYAICKRNNKFLFEYLCTSDAHHKAKEKRRVSFFKELGEETSVDLMTANNLSETIKSLGVPVGRMLKLSKKIDDCKEQHVNNLKELKATLGGSLQYFFKDE